MRKSSKGLISSIAKSSVDISNVLAVCTYFDISQYDMIMQYLASGCSFQPTIVQRFFHPLVALSSRRMHALWLFRSVRYSVQDMKLNNIYKFRCALIQVCIVWLAKPWFTTCVFCRSSLWIGGVGSFSAFMSWVSLGGLGCS